MRPRFSKQPARLASFAIAAAIMGGIAMAQPQPQAPGGGTKAEDAATLSFTAAQAASGKAEYAAHCGDCHGAGLNDGEFGGAPLKGEAFRARWFAQPIGALVSFTSGAMPPDSPGRLPFESYVEIVAYLLNANGVAPGVRALPTDMGALATLRVTPEKGASAGGQ
jgi:mono/diheme cytochrome c family protein